MRAPIFTARFDENKKCLVKETERILVPELGANLATMIGVCQDFFFDDVAYVFVCEFMATYYSNPVQFGSDGSVWLVKVTALPKGQIN